MRFFRLVSHLAFWARNVYELSVQLATIIVIKQIVFNLLELF